MNRNTTAKYFVAMTLAVAGCHRYPDDQASIENPHGEEMLDNEHSFAVGRLNLAQCAAGAKDDGMLYDVNFDGNHLNSLGMGKLDLIQKGTTVGEPMRVYLNMKPDLYTARQLDVTTYLKTSGLKETEFAIVMGPNDGKTTPTAYNLNSIYRPEGASYAGQAADQGAAPGGAPAGLGK